MDALTFLGVLLAALAVTGGQYLHGGEISSLLNLPAFLIVFGGSIGAVMLQTPLRIFKRALAIFHWVIIPPIIPFQSAIEEVELWSRQARKAGILSLEDEIENQSDPFISKCLQLLVTGCDTHTIRRVMETELDTMQTRELSAAHVFESMGGYCPTIGILGAVLGLVHVMRNLADPSELGVGIAVAFIATIYGVALANLFFLPIANKLKNQIDKEIRYHEMVLEGILSIAESDHPQMIALRLNSYVHPLERGSS